METWARGMPPHVFPVGVKDLAVRNTADAPVAVPSTENDPSRHATKNADAPQVEMVDVTIRTNSPVVPGARLSLKIDREIAEGTQFRWSQVEGPSVEIDDPTKPSIQITIPRGTDHLGFLLVAARPESIRVFRVGVPIRSSSTNSWGERPPGRIKADAGHDQVGLVGHRVTLNGSRSVPGDGSTARWLKVGGPPILEPQVQGPFFSFIPSGQGTYRFVLVVSGERAISEPDEVSVLVGLPPAEAASIPSPADFPSAPIVPPATSFEWTVADLVPRLPDGPRIASDVADVMKAIADRSSFYTSFLELQSELTRRLDVVIPSDPSQRAAWSQGIFQPLSTYTAAEILASGLDLRQPQALRQPLTAAQRKRVGEHFQKVARAFRADRAAR
jgi:hypothetical protein